MNPALTDLGAHVEAALPDHVVAVEQALGELTVRVKRASVPRVLSFLRDETRRWLTALSAPREVIEVELAGMTGSVAHLAYHLGAIRQIAKTARGPREGTF